MKDSDVSNLINYFINTLKNYRKEKGDDQLFKEALEFYKNGLENWHEKLIDSSTTLSNKEKQFAVDVILDFINRMKPTQIKEKFTTMKKSELKKLIREVLESIKSLRENYEPTVDDKAEQDAEARADYNQVTQPVVREDEEDEPDPEMLAQFQKWSAAKGGMPHNKNHEDGEDSGYELNDPKHPGYSDRMADRADRARDDAKYAGLEEGGSEQVIINGKEVDSRSIELDGVDTKDYPDFSDAYIAAANFVDGTPLTDQELEELSQNGELVNTMAHDQLHEGLKRLVTNILKETDAFSGMKKVKDKEENTEMKADSEKAITSTTEPKEKKESKKLPVVKKPATPKVTKESKIVKMIRESMEEMARTKGALGRNNAARTTPLKATGLNYQKKGTPGMGRPTSSATADSPAAEDSGYSFTYIDPEGRSTELDTDLPWYSPNQLNAYLESEVMANTGDLDAKLDPMVMQVLNTIQKTPEKIPSHTFTLKYDRPTKTVKIKAERE